MVEFFTAIIIAALTGLSWLAYNHPHAYRPVGMSLIIAQNLIVYALIVWDSSSANTYEKLGKFIIPDKLHETTILMKDSVVSLNWQVPTSLGLSIYLAFLLFLPNFLKQEEETKQENNDKP